MKGVGAPRRRTTRSPRRTRRGPTPGRPRCPAPKVRPAPWRPGRRPRAPSVRRHRRRAAPPPAAASIRRGSHRRRG
ncbi:MAG: hypothetical protein D6705_04305 [Deltaproteobacteria bacterium]|nr:MAG: hypothetical protein D6705_04305 [Deltaproteobacteria bacterium]